MSLGQPAEVVDGLAKHDYEAILAKQGRVAATPACLEAWKALQCATKFPRCAKQVSAHLVCTTLCVQFANACNASESLLLGKGACLDVHKFDAPPCTDYAEPLSADHASWSPDDRADFAGGSLAELLWPVPTSPADGAETGCTRTTTKRGAARRGTAVRVRNVTRL